MKFSAVLSRTTTDKLKSKVQSPELVELVLDVYMTPQEFAGIVEKYFEDSFMIEIKGEDNG